MMIATSEDDDDDDGDGATGNEVDDDGDCATGDGTTGYNDNATMAAARRVVKARRMTTTTMTTTMATAQRDATIKSRRRWRQVATIVIDVQRRIETATRMMKTAPARIARRECGRSVGGRQQSRQHRCGGVRRRG